MENNSKHIDDFFREKLDDYSENPPPAAWDRLEKKLEVRKTTGLSFRGFSYFAMIASVLFLIATVAKKVPVIYNHETETASGSTNDKLLAKNNDAAISTTTSEESVAVETPSVLAAKGAEPTRAEKNKNGNKQTKNNGPLLAVKKQQNISVSGIIPESYSGTSKSENTMGRGPSDPGNSTDGNTELLPASAASAKANLVKEEPAAAKKEQANTKPKKEVVVSDKKTDRVKPSFKRFETGIKGGYEQGFDNDAAKKMVVSPYIQFNVSRRLSVMIQPAVKFASLNTRRIGKPQAYYQVNNDGTIIQEASTPLFLDNIKWYFTPFTYMQTHDSIVKTYTYGGTYTEFELPVLLKYAVGKKTSVYGGLNMSYSQLTSIKENTYTSKPLIIIRDTFTISASQSATPPPIGSVITYKGNPMTEYSGPLYSSESGGLLGFGYMLGFTWQCTPRWLLDGLIQQTSAKTNVVAGFNLNTHLSAPYFRLSVGYKLSK